MNIVLMAAPATAPKTGTAWAATFSVITMPNRLAMIAFYPAHTFQHATTRCVVAFDSRAHFQVFIKPSGPYGR